MTRRASFFRLPWMAAALLLVLLACGSNPTATTTPAPLPTAAPTPEAGMAQIGIRYSHRLFTHCGIQYTNFDGRKWVADPIVKLFGGPNPPYGWKNPYDPGTIELVAEDRALFQSDSGERSFFIDPPEDYDFKLCF